MKNREYSEVRNFLEEEEKVHSAPNYIAYPASNLDF